MKPNYPTHPYLAPWAAQQSEGHEAEFGTGGAGRWEPLSLADMGVSNEVGISNEVRVSNEVRRVYACMRAVDLGLGTRRIFCEKWRLVARVLAQVRALSCGNVNARCVMAC